MPAVTSLFICSVNSNMGEEEGDGISGDDGELDGVGVGLVKSSQAVAAGDWCESSSSLL